MIKAIPNFPCYFADSDGVIYTTRRRGSQRKDWPMVVKQSHYHKRYMKINMINSYGKRATQYVHLIILKTFIGDKPFANAEGRHLNGVSDDNRLINLAWGTQSENQADKLRKKSLKVALIRKFLLNGIDDLDIAILLNITLHSIQKIREG